jgi:hypothetical protein
VLRSGAAHQRAIDIEKKQLVQRSSRLGSLRRRSGFRSHVTV